MGAAQGPKGTKSHPDDGLITMRLTPFAKFFVTVVVLAVIGYVAYVRLGSDVRQWATDQAGGAPPSKTEPVGRDDFSRLKDMPADPDRKAPVLGVKTAP